MTRWAAVLSALLLGILSLQAEERILSYHSRIEVQANADLVVTETLRVTAEGREIKRGIYRDFPQLYQDARGFRRKTGFDVLSVRRDGKPEPWHVRPQANGQRVYIGSKDVVLKTGTYTYELTYRTNRQLGFFEKHDELYWNATGNGWVFPIDQAIAEVRLPMGCPVLSVEAYTGPQGAKGSAYRVTKPEPGVAVFETTAPLGPREGLTVVVTFPKGHVTAPDKATERMDLIRDNLGLALALVGLALVLIYYVVVWNLVGRDPEKGVIFPQYAPPKGVSPAGVRFLSRMGYDNTCFAANVIDLAVKGALTIEKSGSAYVLHRKTRKVPGLTPDEAALDEKLLGAAAQVALKQTNHVRLRGAVNELRARLTAQFEKSHFVKNTKFWLPGLLFTLAPCAVTLLDSREPPGAIFMLVWLSIWTVGVTALLSAVVSLWRSRQWLAALPMTFFALPFLAGEIFGLWAFAHMASVWAPVVFAAGAVINGVFYHLLKAPTFAGRRIMDEIEGFRLYLSVAEKDRLNLRHPPARTPELFEQFLPYALALGVEQRWAEQFEDVLAAAQQGEPGYHPAWYTGAGLSGLSAGALASSLGSSLSSTIASSSTAPGSRSGSGGGGSSGGGGGGGGGGGW